jgi:hypothetical protein
MESRPSICNRRTTNLISLLICFINYVASRYGMICDWKVYTINMFAGSKSAESDIFSRAIKVRSTICFGGEVKLSAPCRKILRHVKVLLKSRRDGWTKFSFPASGFTSHPKEDVLRIFIAFKNPSPWPGTNPRPYGSSGKYTNNYTTKATTSTST